MFWDFFGAGSCHDHGVRLEVAHMDTPHGNTESIGEWCARLRAVKISDTANVPRNDMAFEWLTRGT